MGRAYHKGTAPGPINIHAHVLSRQWDGEASPRIAMRHVASRRLTEWHCARVTTCHDASRCFKARHDASTFRRVTGASPHVRNVTVRQDASRCVAMRHRRGMSRRDTATMCPDASPRVATRHDASRSVAGRGHLESQRVAMRHDVSRCLTTHCDALRRVNSRQAASGCVMVRHRARSCVRFDASHHVVTRRRAGSCMCRRDT